MKRTTGFPLEVMDAQDVLSNTTVMLVDLTQFLYISTNQQWERETRAYPNLQTFINSSDPIGNLEVTSNGVQNTLEIFMEEDAADCIVKRILALESKWKRNCSANGIASKLKSIYLVVDGDSPVAKNETRTKRNQSSHVSCAMRKLQTICKMEGIDISDDELRIRSRFYGLEKRGDRHLCASMQRYLVQRKKRNSIIEHIMECLGKVPSHGTDLFVVHGKEDGIESRGIKQVWGQGGVANLPVSIPYYEADSIIPFLWSQLDDGFGRGCIVSNDSDMMVTLLAVACPRLCLLSNARVPHNSRHRVIDGKVAVAVRSSSIADPRKHLDLLIHLTMGGSDFVEGLPWCGAAALLKGGEAILSRKLHEHHFPNVKLLTWQDVEQQPPHENLAQSDIMRLDHRRSSDDNHIWESMVNLVCQNNGIFPVRMGMFVYLVRLTKQNMDPIYEAYRRWSRGQSFKFVTQNFENCFDWSMKRRLFFLSFVTETRMGLESIMLEREDIAEKCGMSFGDYMYISKMEK